MKPYIVFFDPVGVGREAMWPVFELFRADPGFNTTMVTLKTSDGMRGTAYELGDIRVNRKPSVLVVFKSWWKPDKHTACEAKKQGIPVVMINHGAMFVHNAKQPYKKSLYPADVNCIWGQHDYNIWRMWNEKDRFVITGNPAHDEISNYVCPEIEVPDRFALYLSAYSRRTILVPSAQNLKAWLPVVAKIHPVDKHLRSYNGYQKFFDGPSLLPLIYKAEFIICNVTSAVIPAMYWRKPIWFHSYHGRGYDYNTFMEQFPDDFNWKKNPEWCKSDFKGMVRPGSDVYQHFGHYPDGKNAQRVMEVIKGYV